MTDIRIIEPEPEIEHLSIVPWLARLHINSVFVADGRLSIKTSPTHYSWIGYGAADVTNHFLLELAEEPRPVKQITVACE